MDADASLRFRAARVARLATVRPDGRPHLVPVVFAVVRDARDDGDVVWSAVDDKPKSTRALQRLANVEAHPDVTLLVDHYDDDWSRLWWVRADGTASVVHAGEPGSEEALAALAAKYPQYADRPPAGPFLRVAVTRWTRWGA
ncbi:TIGR03668 family PPOX class F420-dependent oxidoreductase [Terrabacter sp. NPDC080008]|uniref:TIGR03668 family PPOX class F420-dependent oxidoreductase n=1 Tax=Terrabacter sp. NPDC080008 TaxID=3155176 RepID=UPI0034500A96